MRYKNFVLVFAVITLAFVFAKPSPAQAQDIFCRYTASLTILNDQNDGRPLSTFWLGMLFEPGTIVNGEISTGITFTDNFQADIAAGATATDTTTAIANRPPGYFPWATFDLTLPSPSFTDATVVSGPTLTVTDCTTNAPATITQPGLQTGGLPYIIPYGQPDAGGTLPPMRLWDWDETSSSGFVAIHLSSEQMSNLPLNPAQNTEIAASPNGRIRFYVLTTGEFQVNSGPDAEGKVRVVVFNRQFQITNQYEFNVNP
jgi:hypothetical protein